MIIISFINMKGGVGKTTSVVEIGTILATDHNKKVLIIDMDPQTNATFSLMPVPKWEKIKNSGTMADVLEMHRGYSSKSNKFDINKAVIENVSEIENLDLIPSHIELTFLDLDLSGQTGREFILKNKIEKLKSDYDYILIDCPPNLTLAPQNALVVSDYIIVPVVPEVLPAIGLPLLINRITQLKETLPECNVEILGVIFTKVKKGTIIHTTQLDNIRKSNRKLKVHSFSTIIPETVRISEAIAKSKPATLINKTSDGVKAYKILTKEIIKEIDERE